MTKDEVQRRRWTFFEAVNKKTAGTLHVHGFKRKKPWARSLPTASISTGKPVTSQAVDKPLLNSTTNTSCYSPID
jgi:hypothetical protein